MGIAHNEYGNKVLLNIVTNGTDDQGKPSLDTKSIKKVRKIMCRPKQMIRKEFRKIFGLKNLNVIQEALKIKYAQQKID